MAGLTGTNNSNSSTDVIDLTVSDDDITVRRFTAPGFRPLSETPAGEPSGAGFPDHGLLLDRDFGSFSRRGHGRTASFRSHKLLKGGASRLRRRDKLKPSTSSNEHRVLPRVRRIQDYHTSSAKRRRVEPDLTYLNRENEHGDNHAQISSKPKIDVGEKTLGTGPLPAGSPSTSSKQVFNILHQGRDENDTSKDAMNESLKVALRQHVFPHVNQCLRHYRFSIDKAMRRQLGKMAAWEICGADFMNNLMQNDGRLSTAFETEIASMACSLVDQYAAKFVKGADEGHDDPVGSKHEFLLRDRQNVDPHVQSERMKGQEDTAEKVRATRKAELSAAMKGRWAREKMDSVMARKAATLLGRKDVQDTSRYNHGFSRIQKGEVLQPPAMPLKPSVPPVPDGDNENIELPRRQLIVKLRIGDPLHLHSILRHGRSVPGLDESSRSVTRSIGHSPAKETEAPVAVMRHPSNAMNRRMTVRAQIHQKSAPLEMPGESLNQIETLRLSALDENILRPYLSWEHRNDIERGLILIQKTQEPHTELAQVKAFASQGSLLHVDFCQEEIDYMTPVIESVISSKSSSDAVCPKAGIENLMKGCEIIIPEIATALCAAGRNPGGQVFRNRTDSAIAAFLQDAAAGVSSTLPEIKRIGLSKTRSADAIAHPDSIESILRQRETWGRRRNARACGSFKARFLNGIEDNYIRKAEWTDCSGDIATMTWIDSDRFFCGATTHSDEHNMQYNKPGNLLVGTAVENTLKSVPGHQIVRPIVAKGENSLKAMRGTQDLWMYCSVTSTAYSHDNKKCFTGSYDQTVKVWDIAEDGNTMNPCGTWSHSGNVNFVAASPNHSLVATAADVREDAVRVYHFDSSNITASAFNIYEASVQRHNSSDTWAYFPSTIQWGISPSVSHLLLVGYSPRSCTCQDEDIPEDRLNSGELCLWDSRDGSRIPITSARTQNVFEVAWHPTQPIFVAATSPAGTFEDWVKTQLRVFEQKSCGSFSHVKTLDCPAADINEITIKPNSVVDSYVTASCTDGNTYVWDSALSDKPLHILRHGDSIDEYSHVETKEETDIGVKFAAWGSNLDRFYTGSSDGVLKAWNMRAPPGHELVRDVIKLSGGISAGKFSPDFSKLLIGDSTGKVHLLSLAQVEPSEVIPKALRQPIAPHSPLPAPLIDDDDIEIPQEQTAKEIGREFLARGQITIHEDEWVGAIQGPNYASTGLFYNVEEYKDDVGQDSEGWSTQELLEKQQQRYSIEGIKIPQLLDVQSSNLLLHEKNLMLDLNVLALLPETHVEIREARVDLNFQDHNEFELDIRSLEDVEDKEESFLLQNQPLDDSEIQELRILEQQICHELKILKELKKLVLV